MKSNRREFLKGLGLMAAVPVVGGCASTVPGISSGRSPNGRLRVATIGCGGIGKGADIPGFASHKCVEMAAFCDVDLAMMEPLRAKYPKARFYQNWREMLDKESPDAVVVATPDHNHCLIMSEVMRRGMHLYGQKPLCRTFAECRQLESLAASSGVVTQLGAQITPWECDRHTAELIRRGKIGRVEKVWVFSNSGYYAKLLPRKWPLTPSPVPESLDWKGWLEGAPFRPYVAKTYAHFTWRAFRDFGSGWLGDMGTHLMLPVWMGMELGRTVPLSAKADVFDCGWSDEMKRQYLPLYSHVTWQFPGVKASDMKPFEVEWCDGPRDGTLPKEFLPEGKTDEIAGNKISLSVPDIFLPPRAFEALGKESALGELPIQGRVVKGSDGWLISTHFNKPPVMLDAKGKRRPIDLPFLEPVGSHYHDFVDCCLYGGKAATDFGWSTKLVDWLLLGRVAIDNPGKDVKIGS